MSPAAAPKCGAPAAQQVPATFVGVQFVSGSIGWALATDRVLVTHNGGATWSTQYRAGVRTSLQSLDFIDRWHGWALAGNTLLRTDDGGGHWHSIARPCPWLRSVDFVNTDVGFAVAGGAAPFDAIGGLGAQVLTTKDGGLIWTAVTSPANAQTVCFGNADRGWLGADGHIYGTANAGRSWELQLAEPHPATRYPGTAEVRCIPGSSAGWAEVIGPGGASSQEPHVAYHTDGTSWTPIFAEQYFAHPGVVVSAQSPGLYAGPFAPISASRAVYIDSCSPCTPPNTPRPSGTDYTTYQGTAPMVMADDAGARLKSRGAVTGLTSATSTDFTTAANGWAVGLFIAYHLAGSHLSASSVSRIVHTSDGGVSWRIQYQFR